MNANLRLTFVLGMLLVSANAARCDTVARSAISREIAERIRSEHKYNPPASVSPIDTSSENGEIVVMEKITVQSSLIRRDLEESLQKQHLTPGARRPKLFAREKELNRLIEEYRSDNSTFGTSRGIKLFSSSWR